MAEDSGPMRVQKFLSRAGICSRRRAEELLLQGRVRINGRVCTELGTKVDPKADRIEVDGRPVRIERGQGHVYLLLNKPRGVLTTLKDPFGRPTIKDILSRYTGERVFPVGRLDRDSEGLLLCTNDGELSNRLLHPRYKVDKVYVVTVDGEPGPDQIALLEGGRIEIEGRRIKPCTIEPVRKRRRGGNKPVSTWRITLKEGRKRQIRQMFKAIGHRVLRLERVAMGPLHLKGLPPGKARSLTAGEIEALRRAAGLLQTKGSREDGALSKVQGRARRQRQDRSD